MVEGIERKATDDASEYESRQSIDRWLRGSQIDDWGQEGKETKDKEDFDEYFEIEEIENYPKKFFLE